MVDTALEGEVYRCSVLGSYDGQPVANVLHFRAKTSGNELGGLVSVVEEFLACFTPYLSTTLTFTTLKVNQLTIPARSWEYALGGAVGGEYSGDGLPGTVAIVASYKTSFAGKRYRGRSYIPALVDTQATRGVIMTIQLLAMQTALDDFLAVYGFGGTDEYWAFGVWSRTLGEARNSSGTVIAYDLGNGMNIVSSAVVRQALGTIRGRRYGS